MGINRTNEKIKPFLKWVGGKRQLLKEIEKHFPSNIQNYFEPFTGAGAVAFKLVNDNLVQGDIYLNDKNYELTTTYDQVINNTNNLIKKLKTHKEKNTKEYFLSIRRLDRVDSWFTKELLHDPLKVAARMIYMNKVCFNGLYRINQSGQFNSPYGKYVNPNIVDEDNLLNISKKLSKVQITNKDFDFVENIAIAGDLVYFDPPYIPESKTKSFVAYTHDGFGYHDQIRLRDLAITLIKRGVNVILSNSDTPITRKLYEGEYFEFFSVNTVSVKRSINSKGDQRKGKEVIIVGKIKGD